MKINANGNTEAKRFDAVVRKLLSVSYVELRRRLNLEDLQKNKRKAAKPSAASRASGDGT